MNKLIGEGITTTLILAIVVLLGLLYSESTERPRLLAGVGLTIVGVLCLEILLLQR